MQVVFRSDAGNRIGHGHLMRCLALAGALRERDGHAHFVCREHEGHLCDLVTAHGFPVTRLALDTDFGGEAAPGYASWLGARWDRDAEETRAALAAAGGVDWLVVDHYALDERWERVQRGVARAIMAIDDLADRPHDCDLLLDQNLIEGYAGRYTGKTPPECSLLLGPSYALLHPIYRRMHEQARPRQGAVRRVLVFFGGADVHDLTGRAVSAFLRLRRADIALDVVLAPGFRWEESLQRRAAGHENVTVHVAPPTLAPLLAQADLALGAGGTSAWERLCLGLPALVITLAENQRAIGEALDRYGLARLLGHVDTVTEDDIAAALGETLRQGLAPEWSERCLAAVDGCGAERVCQALHAREA